VREVAVSSAVLSALKQLFGREPLPFQTLNFPVGTRQRSHSDTIHFNSIPRGFMAGVWVALEDIDRANGPLQYYPGSHKLPEYSMQDFNLKTGYSNYHKYEECIDRLIRDNGLVAEFGLVKRGEAIIWHPNLLHGGAEQLDPRRTRHSQVTHYFFSDCEYVTPMEGSREQPAYREPLWIPKTSEELRSLSTTSVTKKVRQLVRRIF
jgi:ectoine hydroxylase-related dioxygenase (phytanoyl-CoA dioxygenase family)